MRLGAPVAFHDLAPKLESFRDAVLDGLSRPQKRIPCRFLYDERGSDLFEAICETPEYYPTRTEIGILEKHAPRDGEADRTRRDADRIRQRRRAKSEAVAARARPAAGLCRHRVSREILLRATDDLSLDFPNLAGGRDLRRFPGADCPAGGVAARRRAAGRFLSRLQHRQFHAARKRPRFPRAMPRHDRCRRRDAGRRRSEKGYGAARRRL